MHRLLIPGLAILALGCYRPRVEGDCEVGCDQMLAPACPNGMNCGSDNLCYVATQCDQKQDASVVDMPIGNDVTLVDAEPDECYTTFLLGAVCPTSVRPSYAPTAIDTDFDCDQLLDLPSGNTACLIATDLIALVDTIRIHGSRPLVLYVRSTVVIPATAIIDLSDAGAGADTECQPAPDGPSQPAAGGSAGGGAGGTFVGTGGPGGAPDGGMSSNGSAGAVPTFLRGGCSGGRGGMATNGVFAAAGRGGGALQLISRAKVVHNGHIDAFGTGGRGASTTVSTSAGGGGGGSGGLVAIDAPSIQFGAASLIVAHGGGGGGGSQGSGTSSGGLPGSSTSGTPAGAGSGVGVGSANGGVGSGDAMVFGAGGGNATAGSGAGGGGGGAAGAILLNGSVTLGGGQHPIPTIRGAAI